MSLKIIGLSTLRGALPVTQKRPTVDVRFFTGDSAFSIYLKDDTFFNEDGSELKPYDVEKLKTHFLAYVSEGEPEYDLVKAALQL